MEAHQHQDREHVLHVSRMDCATDGSCETLAVGGTEVSQLRSHSQMAEATFNALILMAFRASLSIQNFMQLLGCCQKHTPFSEKFVCSGDSESKLTHVKRGNLKKL